MIHADSKSTSLRVNFGEKGKALKNPAATGLPMTEI
jgi:hypothetical protein